MQLQRFTPEQVLELFRQFPGQQQWAGTSADVWRTYFSYLAEYVPAAYATELWVVKDDGPEFLLFVADLTGTLYPAHSLVGGVVGPFSAAFLARALAFAAAERGQRIQTGIMTTLSGDPLPYGQPTATDCVNLPDADWLGFIGSLPDYAQRLIHQANDQRLRCMCPSYADTNPDVRTRLRVAAEAVLPSCELTDEPQFHQAHRMAWALGALAHPDTVCVASYQESGSLAGVVIAVPDMQWQQAPRYLTIGSLGRCAYGELVALTFLCRLLAQRAPCSLWTGGPGFCSPTSATAWQGMVATRKTLVNSEAQGYRYRAFPYAVTSAVAPPYAVAGAWVT